MLRVNRSWVAVASLGFALLVGACGDDTENSGGMLSRASGPEAEGDLNTVFVQREFLGNPLVSEVTVPKRLHDEYNTNMPYRQVARFKRITEEFITGVAGRPQALAEGISGVLYPDVLVAYLDRDPSTAFWLSWAVMPDVGWGGRRLQDDAVDIGLGAIFGSLLLDDKTVNRGLDSDNVPFNEPLVNTFPYVGLPNQ
jgi:hypothetical protein